MRVYVASCFEDFARTRRAQTLLRAGGCDISFDWTYAADEYPGGDATALPEARKQAAILDMGGVMDAHAILLLTPNDKAQGCGCWIELGMAIAFNKRIVITGLQRERTIFAEFGERFATDEAGVDYLLRVRSDRITAPRPAF